VKSRTTERFRKAFERLPERIQNQAQQAYKLFGQNPYHPNLPFGQLHPTRSIHSVRISLGYPAVGIREGDEIIWFWIGSHAEYDRLISRL
jgi:hypothetical protein